jgi:Rieske 2Fe-2S family protein
MMLALLPDYVMVHTLWPQSPSSTVIECQWLFHSQMQGSPQVASPDGLAGEAQSAPGGDHLDPQRGVEFWDRVNQEDWHVSELTQKGVRSSRYEPGPYSDREAMSASIDRHYLERMGGSASGQQQES